MGAKPATILWAVCFLLCNVGFWELLRRRLSVRVEYLPSLTAACQVTLLFVAGIFSCLPVVAAVLWCVGLGSLLVCAIRDRSLAFLRNYRKPAFLFLAVFAAAFFAACWGRCLTEYDNFTHWGTVLKCMLLENRFPDARDTVIEFQAYPLGAAIYMYFGLCFPGIGMREDLAMFLQSLQMIFFVMPLFTRAGKNQGAATVFLSLVMIFFVSTSLGLLDLRVDVLLPLAASCMLLYINDYCLEPGAARGSFFSAAFYLVSVMQIKNSAILFVAMGMLGILLAGKKDKRWGMRLLLAAIPLPSWLLWRQYYSHAYAAAETSLHAMTLKNYLRTFHSNPVRAILSVAKQQLLFALTFRKVLLCAGCLVLCGVLVHFVWPAERKAFRRLLAFSLIFYAVYQAGMLGMYVFSMGTEESLGIPSAARYTNTALFVINYMLASLCTRLLSAMDARQRKQAVCMGAILLMYPVRMLLAGETPFFTQLKQETEPLRVTIQRAMEAQGVENSKRCCLLVPEGDNGYAYYVVRYLLMTDQVRNIPNATREDLQNIQEECVLVLDPENEAVKAWLPGYTGRVVTGIEQ